MTRHGCWITAALFWGVLPAVCASDAPTGNLSVTVGKSLILDTPSDLRRVSVANGDVAEALAVTPREVLINGKAPGETTVILWQQDGTRSMFDLTVRPNTARIEAVRHEILRGSEARKSELRF